MRLSPSKLEYKFILNQNLVKKVNGEMLQRLLQTSANLWQVIYNPTRKRLGTKFLETPPVGPLFLGWWPSTIRESLGEAPAHHSIVHSADNLKEHRQNLLNVWSSIPVKTANVFKSFMIANDIKRNKKRRVKAENSKKK